MNPQTDSQHEHRCPICQKSMPAQQAQAAQDKYFPFCSQRCRRIDLGKWLGGDYMISRPIEQSDLDEV